MLSHHCFSIQSCVICVYSQACNCSLASLKPASCTEEFIQKKETGLQKRMSCIPGLILLDWCPAWNRRGRGGEGGGVPRWGCKKRHRRSQSVSSRCQSCIHRKTSHLGLGLSSKLEKAQIYVFRYLDWLLRLSVCMCMCVHSACVMVSVCIQTI